MFHKQLMIILVFILFLIAACDQAAEEAVPTLAILPSPTASDTPTNTPPATATNTPTATRTPTSTQTPTSTKTFTPTVSVTASVTATSSLTPTFTETPTPTATQTPTLSATPLLPTITVFDANKTSAAPGEQVTLRWESNSDSARIERLDAQGGVLETIPVPTSGTQIFNMPQQGPSAIFRLVAIRGANQVDLTVSVAVSCVNAWFFGNEFAPSGAGCPAGPALTVVGGFQPFQSGLTIHFVVNAENRVCGLQNDGSAYLCYTNGWDGSTITPYTAPAGLFPPEQIFNWLYSNTNASAGVWSNKLGWATANINTNPITIQFDSQQQVYVNTIQGVYYLPNSTGAGTWAGQWQKIK